MLIGDEQTVNTPWIQAFWCNSAKAQKCGKFSFMSTKIPRQCLSSYLQNSLRQKFLSRPFLRQHAKTSLSCFRGLMMSSDCFSTTSCVFIKCFTSVHPGKYQANVSQPSARAKVYSYVLAWRVLVSATNF